MVVDQSSDVKRMKAEEKDRFFPPFLRWETGAEGCENMLLPSRLFLV